MIKVCLPLCNVRQCQVWMSKLSLLVWDFWFQRCHRESPPLMIQKNSPRRTMLLLDSRWLAPKENNGYICSEDINFHFQIKLTETEPPRPLSNLYRQCIVLTLLLWSWFFKASFLFLGRRLSSGPDILVWLQRAMIVAFPLENGQMFLQLQCYYD